MEVLDQFKCYVQNINQMVSIGLGICAGIATYLVIDLYKKMVLYSALKKVRAGKRRLKLHKSDKKSR